MSIDSIVKISIEAQNLSMAQKGFGVPLILGFKDTEKPHLEIYKDAGELPSDEAQVYKIAQAIFSQQPSVSLIKIGFAKAGSSIEQSLKAISDLDSDFYAILLADSPKAQELSDVAAFLESNRLILGLDVNGATKDAFQNIKSDRIFFIYNQMAENFLAASWMGRMLPLAPGSSSWAYNELKNVTPYSLSTSLAFELEKLNINRFINIKGVGITLDGKMSSGKFIDVTCGIDWLHVRMQERLFRLLVINKKIPYTLKGIDLVRCEILAQLKEAIYQGILAEDPEPTVSTPTIEEIDPQIRSDRILPKIRFSGRLAGAIHKIEIQGTVNV